jgi:predicted TIM-barrel fold metal-dependent hydrolase
VTSGLAAGRGDGVGPVTGVDAHAHVLRMDAPLVAQRHSRPSRDAPVADYLARLDAAGLSHGILTAPSFYGTDNTVLLDALAVAPHRLRATVTVGPGASTQTLVELAALGVVGIRLNWSKRKSVPDPFASDQQALFCRARDAGLHVEVMVEEPYLPRICDAVLRTGAMLMVDHVGLAAGADTPGFTALLRAMEQGSTWVKLSGPYRLPTKEVVALAEALVRTAPERVLWGSDWPWVQHERDVVGFPECLAWLGDWVPDPAARHMILVSNPTRAFRLNPAQPGHRTVDTRQRVGEDLGARACLRTWPRRR